MEAFRLRKSQLSERFLTVFSSVEPTATTDFAEMEEDGVAELDEDEMFLIESGLSSTTITRSTTTHPSPPKKSPALLTRSHSETLHCVPSEKIYGILAVLPEDDGVKNKTTTAAGAAATAQRPRLLQRKSSLPSPSSISSDSLKTSIPKPKPRAKPWDIWDWDRGRGGGIRKGKRPLQQSAPVNIMICPRKNWREEEIDDEEDDGKMLPPHEIVDLAKESPMTTFSVLEGVGRTLKGRDLRRVRNAVWRQTGFLD